MGLVSEKGGKQASSIVQDLLDVAQGTERSRKKKAEDEDDPKALLRRNLRRSPKARLRG